MSENKIHRRKPTSKPALNPAQKEARLAFCTLYRDLDWQSVIFTDESHFETGNLRRHPARGVLWWAGEAYRAQNIQRKFAQGATVIFWGAILYRKSGNYFLIIITIIIILSISISITIIIIRVIFLMYINANIIQY